MRVKYDPRSRGPQARSTAAITEALSESVKKIKSLFRNAVSVLKYSLFKLLLAIKRLVRKAKEATLETLFDLVLERLLSELIQFLFQHYDILTTLAELFKGLLA